MSDPKPSETATPEGAAHNDHVADPRSPPWHAMPLDAVLDQLRSRPDGLSPAEAAERLATHGPNRLPRVAARGPLVRFLVQFHNLLIYALLGAAAVAAAIGHGVDALVILCVVLFNTVIGFIQEGRAEKALEAIRGMIDPHASVIRAGRRMTIPAEDVVAGDLVVLEAGDRIAADLRLIRARSLRIEEAVLTGESVAVEKMSDPVLAAAPIGDRGSMAFSGTFVVAGQGAGVAVATGGSTELGRISAMIGAVETLKTHLIRQMDVFAKQLTLIILGLSAVVFAFAIFMRDYDPTAAFMAVVALAVAAIPEGLPAVMTITLAIGVQRMASRNAIIRRLPAVETLGSVSVICSDKTGTLTRNEMTVQTVVTADNTFEVSGVGYEPSGGFRLDGRDIDPADYRDLADVARAALLCNDADLRRDGDHWLSDGDPMEGALVALSVKAGNDAARLRKQLPRTDAIPFDSQHRFMATLHHSHDNGKFAVIKGAPERLVAMCDRQAGTAGDAPINPGFWRDRTDALAAEGQRVLAVATKAFQDDKLDLHFADVECGLTLVGILGLIDPPREEAIAAVASCRTAGIRVKMITGDHAITAAAIARQLGLADRPIVVTGQELDQFDPEALRASARDAVVFARTSPENKLRLVEALQAGGAIVAMTGDGVNDAPALKRADVGVAMGRNGTEAAKEAAEMVLADDNFASIVAAVREGRTVYDNLQKTIAFLLPINGGESLSVVAAILVGVALPIAPTQILWVNMVSSVALAATLAFEPTERDIMVRPPRRPDDALLSRFVAWRIMLVSTLFLVGIFGMYEFALGQGASVELARTVAVNTLVAMEVFYLFSVRYLQSPSFTFTGVKGTPRVIAAVVTVFVLQLIFTYAPFMQSTLGTAAVPIELGPPIIAAGVAVLVILEFEKFVRRRLKARSASA